MCAGKTRGGLAALLILMAVASLGLALGCEGGPEEKDDSFLGDIQEQNARIQQYIADFPEGPEKDRLQQAWQEQKVSVSCEELTRLMKEGGLERLWQDDGSVIIREDVLPPAEGHD